MQDSLTISNTATQKWVEFQNLPYMNYRDLADEELIRECAGNPCHEAWEELVRRFRRLIASVALRACREWSQTAPDIVEDMVQNTFLKLCADNCSLLRRFESRHPGAFLGYLKTVTANIVYDHFRAEHAIRRDVTQTIELDDAIHQLQSDVGSMSPSDLEVFLNEINDLLRRRGAGAVEERERAIFWLYYRHGLTAKEIASIPSMTLTVKGVESVIHRLTSYVKETLIMQ
jgi:RNA polymerase sigma-70 factor, ECF subfamily